VPNPTLRRSSAALAAALALSACGRDGGAAPRTASASATDSTPLGRVARPGAPYRVVTVLNGGSVRGRVTAGGDPPRDTVVRATRDSAVCGAEIADGAAAAVDGKVGEAVVWLAGVRAGKAPPGGRRYELRHERCRFVARVQAVLVGGTVNVHSLDRALHETRFLRRAGGSDSSNLVAHAHTNDDAQVVPVDQLLREPGLVEARCAVHPWSRGWLFAFDHPYVATTAADGSFTIDDVPPGRYTLVVWHERAGIERRDVTVGAGREVTEDVEVEWGK
jgi:hypothetical protein